MPPGLQSLVLHLDAPVKPCFLEALPILESLSLSAPWADAALAAQRTARRLRLRLGPRGDLCEALKALAKVLPATLEELQLEAVRSSAFLSKISSV